MGLLDVTPAEWDRTDYGAVRRGIRGAQAMGAGLLGIDDGSVMDGTASMNRDAQLGGLLADAATGAIPFAKTGLLGMAIDREAKKRLVADLAAGAGSGTYRLGDVTPGQLNGLARLFGRAPAGPDVMMTNRALDHLVEARLGRDGMSPDDVGRFATQAMLPRSVADMNAAKSQQNPSLLNRGLLEQGTRYDARMPLGLDDEGVMFVRSVVPEGLKKKSPSK